MKTIKRLITLIYFVATLSANAADLTIPNGGRVVIELGPSHAAFDNTLSIISPANATIAVTGCQLQPAVGLNGLHIVNEQVSQRGCRVVLDADDSTNGIQDFAAGTVFEFGLCTDTSVNEVCNWLWSSNSAKNSDGKDHLQTSSFAATPNAWLLRWEDQTDLGDQDFADLVVVFRLAQDTDGDGLWDDWETSGDTDGDGIADLYLPGADPLRKDLFVEVDCLVDDGNNNGSLLDPEDHSHCPSESAIRDVVTAFANAPLTNEDGTTGIQLHIDIGQIHGNGIKEVNLNGITGTYGDLRGGNTIDEAGNEIIDWDGAEGKPATSFYDLKAANFDAGRFWAYRYAIIGHQVNARRSVNDCTSGWGELGGNDFIVSLGGYADLDGDGTGDIGCWGSTAANNFDDDGDGAIDEDPRDGIDNDGDCVPGTDTDGDGTPCTTGDLGVDEDGGYSIGSRAQMAGTFMHELGHTLALGHGGGDKDNNKPNYLSVMNYLLNFQFCGVPASAAAAGAFPGGCSYSTTVLPTIAGELDESNLDECQGIDEGAGWFGPFDWNGGGLSGVTNCNPPRNANVSTDINSDGFRQKLAGYDDWNNILYTFQNTDAYANGISESVDDELTPEIQRAIQKRLKVQYAPGISLELDTPATALPGDTITAKANLSNTGRGPALQTALTIENPFGGKGSFDLDVIPVGGDQSRSRDYSIPDGTCPQMLKSTASLSYSNFSNLLYEKEVTAKVEVLDNTPPQLVVSVTPDTLTEPNHKLVDISALITIVDECDPNPQVTLVSITSDEAANGLGDGQTSRDIRDAEFGTDDRAFRLRNERSGLGDGRIYTIVYEASDSSGNTTQRTANVEVIKSNDE